MSTINRKHFNTAIAIVIAMVSQLLCSCVNEDFSDCPIVDEVNNATTYISFSISTLDVPTASRSNPTGGEDGDGREVGINNENNISDVSLFLFESSNANVLNTTDNPAVSAIHVSQFRSEGTAGNDYTYQTYPIEVEKTTVSANTRVIAVANAGNLSGINTLNDLRNYVSKDVVVTSSTNIANYSKFVMSSASLSTFVVVDKDGKELGTYENPATVSINIQRMAARIDIVPNKELTSGYYEYGVIGTSDKIRITHITPFNCWKPEGGQYLLKRVGTDGTETNKTILGLETPQSGNQTNYVLSLQMANKLKEYWTDNAATVKGWYRNHVTEALTPKAVTTTTNTDADSKKYYILDYTQENTMQIAGQLNCYTTGILAQATYVPEKVYEADGKTVATSYTDLWLLEGKFYSVDVAGATKYTNGQCYYRYYIRHSNNSVLGEMGVMEFGIVRNNIYRLTLNGIGEIGSPTPEPEDPKDMDEYLNIHIEVKKWAVRTHDEVVM